MPTANNQNDEESKNQITLVFHTVASVHFTIAIFNDLLSMHCHSYLSHQIEKLDRPLAFILISQYRSQKYNILQMQLDMYHLYIIIILWR